MSESPEERKARAEEVGVSDRTALEQLEALSLDLSEVKGKSVLILGSGKDYALEKALADAGAEVVVALSANIQGHDKEDVREARPQVWPVMGYFHEMPPAQGSFDLVISVYGFPAYMDAAEIKPGYNAIIEALAPEGRGIFIPAYDSDREDLQQLSEERGGDFAFSMKLGELDGQIRPKVTITKGVQGA